MKSSALELERYFFIKVHLDAIQGGNVRGEIVVNPSVDLREKIGEDRRFLVQLDVNIGNNLNDNPRYRGGVSVVGYFKVDPDYPGDLIELAGINGTSILYSAVREMVANVTARGPWGAFILPCVSFLKEPKKHSNVSTQLRSVKARPKSAAARRNRGGGVLKTEERNSIRRTHAKPR
jgi:preprotein translocase subunit SecB